MRASKLLRWIVGVVVALAGCVYVAFQVSPWPGVLLIRRAFEKDAAKTSAALGHHVPLGVSEMLDLRYDDADDDAFLDVFYPSAVDTGTTGLPTIVWVHGGGWVSGNKRDIANYARILASRGYTAVGVAYSTAPGQRYPTPLRQVNAALEYLVANAQYLHVDPSRLFLAGDSGGASIVAQVANVVAVPSYAQELGIIPSIEPSRLAGVLLFCGAYDLGSVNLDGSFGGFLRTVLWAYSGGKDFMTNPQFATLSIVNYVTPEYPPTFISAGNEDPLLPHSRALASVLARHGVFVDALFFAEGYSPSLPHEYQFNLDTEAGQLAFERVMAFVARPAHE